MGYLVTVYSHKNTSVFSEASQCYSRLQKSLSETYIMLAKLDLKAIFLYFASKFLAFK